MRNCDSGCGIGRSRGDNIDSSSGSSCQLCVVVVVDMCTCAFETLQQNRWSMLSGSGRLVGGFIHAPLRR